VKGSEWTRTFRFGIFCTRSQWERIKNGNELRGWVSMWVDGVGKGRDVIESERIGYEFFVKYVENILFLL